MFVCPACNGGLDLNNAVSGNEESLVCKECGAAYPVVKGIPRFVEPGNYSSSFGYQWNLHRQAQLDSHSGLPISRRRVYQTTGWPEELKGDLVLEAGSGAGRFTEVLVATGAHVFSFDYSSAVEANHENNGKAANLHLFQGDIFRIPVKQAAFDKVFCLGVLQHTPDPEAAFQSLVKYVKPGGQLVIDVYAKRLTALRSWKYGLFSPMVRRDNE